MKYKILFSLIGFVGVGVLLFLLSGLFPGIVYSDGHRSGTIYRVSYKGYSIPPFSYKTYEGELSLGLNEQDAAGAVVARTWEFSVTDKNVITELEEAERLGKRVTLHYREYSLRGRYYGKTAYNILGVLSSDKPSPNQTNRIPVKVEPNLTDDLIGGAFGGPVTR